MNMTEISRQLHSQDTESSWGDWHNEGYPVERINKPRSQPKQVISSITKGETPVKQIASPQIRHDFYDDMLSNQMANGGE